MMKPSILLIAAHLFILAGCTRSHDADSSHAHDEHGNHISSQEETLEPLVYTLYSDKTELFVEFKPLVAGQESRVAAHFTKTGDLFTAVDSGSVTLSLVDQAGQAQSITADRPEVPGIFRLRMTPAKKGVYNLVFDIRTPAFTDQITIEKVGVFPDEKMARLATQGMNTDDSNDITWLKEQAWKVEFANAPAQIMPFSEVVKTSGQILHAPGDEAVLTAQINGILTYAEKQLVSGMNMAAGTTLFTIKGTDVALSGLAEDVRRAENEFATAQKQYDRAVELVKDKLISEKEFLEINRRLELARSQRDQVSLSKAFNQKQANVRVPVSGYLNNIWVDNGAYVQAGQPLATISKGRRLVVRADLSQKYFSRIHSFRAANFKSVESGYVYATNDLNGKLISTGKSVTGGSPFLPVYFEIDQTAGLIPGSTVEVFLLSNPKPSLVIPVTALLEEQGVFYAYVQTSGERFQKRELQIGASDGMHVQVLSGIMEGERIVTRGAYQIKLSTATGTMPAHGHEH